MLGTGLPIVLSLVIGLAISYYFSNRRSLSCIVFGRRILDPIGRIHPGVEILFEGNKVDSLSEWTVAIWNSGNQTIHEADIADPIELIFSNSDLLKGTAPIASRNSTKPSLSLSQDTLKIDFNYLDKGDAIAFTVYTVPKKGKRSVSIRGNIRGIPRGPTITTDLDIPSSRQKLMVLSMMILLMVLAAHAFAMVISSGHQLHLWAFDQSLIPSKTPDTMVGQWGKFVFFSVFFIFFAGLMAFVTREIIRWFVETPRWVRDNVTQIVSQRR